MLSRVPIHTMLLLGIFALISGAGGAQAQKLTGAQVIAKCKQAYAGLKSYDGVSQVSVVTQQGNAPVKYNTSAHIQFARPNRIRVGGRSLFGSNYAYLSNGSKTWQALTPNNWQEVKNTEAAIAGATGISMSAGTTIPAILLNTRWGNAFITTMQPDPAVVQDKLNGKTVYRARLSNKQGELILWIDPKTFLMVKLYEKRDLSSLRRNSKNAFQLPNSMEYTHLFTAVKPNASLPASVFTKP